MELPPQIDKFMPSFLKLLEGHPHLCIWSIMIGSGLTYLFNINQISFIIFINLVVFSLLEIIISNSSWHEYKYIDLLCNLGDDEKEIIFKEFIKPNHKIAKLTIHQGELLFPIITRGTNLSIPTCDIPNIPVFNYSIQPWAWRYLKKYPEILQTTQ